MSFSWPTRLPQQLPTSSRYPLCFFWLTRIPSSNNQRHAAFRILVLFLVNTESKSQLPTSSRVWLQTFWLRTIPSSRNQRQTAFRSFVFFVPNQDSSALTNRQQSSPADFLANQDSQQQKPSTSGLPQPSTFLGQPLLPTSSYQPAVEICSSLPTQPGVPAAAINEKRHSAV